MTTAIQFPNEERSNAVRRVIADQEPAALRTYTPTQAVFAKSAGCFHWTPEGRRLYDYASGVLVANLGHNPRRWMRRFAEYLGWKPDHASEPERQRRYPSEERQRPSDGSFRPAGAGGSGSSTSGGSDSVSGAEDGYFEAVTLTAYNAITEIEARAVERLVRNLRSFPGGDRLETVMWAASGSEAIQKALWACLHDRDERDLIIATRHGFHGKKGLAGAVTGSEDDADRDPRVKFVNFPKDEVDDVSRYGEDIDLSEYRAELESLWQEYGNRLNCLITEPYLGGGGSYHPPASYLQLLQQFCRQHDVLFILDEVQSNFGRTGTMYAFEKYGVEPDIVCLGKGLGNGVPVSAAVGRRDVFASLSYGEGSDTWSANPLSCAAVLATLDEFETTDVLNHAGKLSEMFLAGLEKLKGTGLIKKVRGEGMVFGIECGAVGGRTADEVANAVVEACYLGEPGGDGIHLLGPLAGTVLRVSPPMTLAKQQAHDSLQLMYNLLSGLAAKLESQKLSAATR